MTEPEDVNMELLNIRNEFYSTLRHLVGTYQNCHQDPKDEEDENVVTLLSEVDTLSKMIEILAYKAKDESKKLISKEKNQNKKVKS